MKTLRMAMLATLLLTACDFDVGDLNRPGLDTLQKPTVASVQALATGLLIGARKGVTERVGLVVEWGILGREALVLTPSDPRFVNELLQGSLDPGSNNFGGNFWVIPYSNIRGANLLLHALDNPSFVGFTAAQKEATRGFAKTIQALDYLQVVDAHDVNGAVLNVDLPLGQVAPIVTSTDQIFTFIETLLDDAKTSLTAGGTAFPFPLGTGFTGFDTPATFLKFNRALRARVAVYHQKYADALTALGESFIDDTKCPSSPPADPACRKSLDTGAFHAFGSGSGDTPNVLNTSDILCHPSTVTDADAGDLRVLTGPAAKVKMLTTPVALSDHGSSYGFTLYPNSDSPIPIIRNEELILLRAEANCAASTSGSCTGDTTAAATDIDRIRVNSGGLAPSSGLNASNILDELLKQKRYSLLFEGGHRWIDLRRYGKLDASHVAIDIPADVIHPVFPIPLTETQAR
ncbi:MAG: RagB/SusD family nutrient uptake outer membrane protein [Deltaproteobacteria bacterium]|nr:MAG: RagB/SusD family nutrient uptake outer membrane protein [Deltaproteobacteria bacterium]